MLLGLEAEGLVSGVRRRYAAVQLPLSHNHIHSTQLIMPICPIVHFFQEIITFFFFLFFFFKPLLFFSLNVAVCGTLFCQCVIFLSLSTDCVWFLLLYYLNIQSFFNLELFVLPFYISLYTSFILSLPFSSLPFLFLPSVSLLNAVLFFYSTSPAPPQCSSI